jgi:hypothetical protein
LGDAALRLEKENWSKQNQISNFKSFKEGNRLDFGWLNRVLYSSYIKLNIDLNM